MTIDRRADRQLIHCHLDPLPARRYRRRLARTSSSDVAQDFEHYTLRDYARRAARGKGNWRDLRPAYAFALISHAAGWPRGGDEETETELAAQWDRMRGTSRLGWATARPVIEDAWQALDQMPAVAPATRWH